MPNMLETESISRSLLPIIYVLDTSGSMKGTRIEQLNKAMEKTTDILEEVAAHNTDAEIRIGILKFSTEAEWMYDQLKYPSDFYWKDLEAGGLTDVGAALRKLNEKLSRKEWLDNGGGNKLPVLIFMSDGNPTDDYAAALKQIDSENKWFHYALKIAIAIGDDANKKVLGEICGDPGRVIEVKAIESLVTLIGVVSRAASKIGSQSRVANGDPVNEILSEVKKEMPKDPGIFVAPEPAVPPEPAGSPDGDGFSWDFQMGEGW